jgi:hypothetical protein
MNVSRSFTRCGVLVTYLLYMPWRMSCAVPLPADLVRAGAEVVVVWGPVEAGVRCLGGIAGCIAISCRQLKVLARCEYSR